MDEMSPLFPDTPRRRLSLHGSEGPGLIGLGNCAPGPRRQCGPFLYRPAPDAPARVVAVPHAGRAYPPHVLARMRRSGWCKIAA